MVAAQKGENALQALDYLTTRPFFNSSAKDKMKNTLMHHAAMTNNVQTAKLLVDKFPGIEKESRNVLGQTPLEIAMQNGNVDMYKYLMSLVSKRSVFANQECYRV